VERNDLCYHAIAKDKDKEGDEDGAMNEVLCYYDTATVDAKMVSIFFHFSCVLIFHHDQSS